MPKIKFVEIIFASILSLCIIIGCNSDDDNSALAPCDCESNSTTTCVLYEQTGCADPWGGGALNDPVLIDNFIAYFDAFGVTLFEVGMDSNGLPEVCNACHCKSGQRFCARVANDDLDFVLERGFIKNE